MNTGDHHLIKNINRGIILETIIEEETISRAQLSKITGLNKATITSQVAELIKEELVIETKFDKSTGGRKPILLTLNKQGGLVIGIEIDGESMNILLSDLKGNILHKKFIQVDTASYEDTRKILVKEIREIMSISQIDKSACRYGVIGIGIGVHGIVDKKQEIVFATHSKWRYVDLKNDLSSELEIPTYVENNTNLCAYAEKVFYVNDPNLLCLTISTGIGLGIVIDNVVFKGLNGFAGEVGHMIINEKGRRCSCGNTGCWEVYASEKAFLQDISDKKNLKSCSLEEVNKWIQEKDEVTMNALKELGKNLSIGINNVINTFNPETIILNSELIRKYPPLIGEIEARLKSKMSNYKKILYSKIGKDACALGGCAIVISEFLNISDLKLTKEYD